MSVIKTRLIIIWKLWILVVRDNRVDYITYMHNLAIATSDDSSGDSYVLAN